MTVEEWDLTTVISPYLDRHMVFPLLEFIDTNLLAKNLVSYQAKDIGAARLALLRPTHMVDYAMDTYKIVHGENAAIPKEMEEQKHKVYQALEELKKGCAPLDKICKDEEERNKLMSSGKFTLAGIQKHDASITADVVESYRQLARFMFDCGDYKAARDMLTYYIQLHAISPTQTDEEDEVLIAAGLQQQQQSGSGNETGNPDMYFLPNVDEKMLQVLWGRLASEILAQDWEAAAKAVDAVKTALEMLAGKNTLSPLEALQQRTWLLHWSLFVYWNDSAGLERLVDLFHSERYKQAITTNAPHLLRYLTAAVLLCKRRVNKKTTGGSSSEARRLLKNLTNVMQDCEYTDPIVEFVNCLCVKFDFDSAQLKLAECNQVLAADFFLCEQTDLFMEEARVFVFENYCRIHHKIDLAALGEKLAMDQESAERWIVDLIRNAALDAKIDTAEACVVMGGSQVSVYEQVMDRTRDLNVRSATLQQNFQALLQESRKEKARKEAA